MFRCLNDVLSIQSNESDIEKILTPNNSSESEQEKFIIGIKIIYNSRREDIGLKFLESIKHFDSCRFIEPSFIAELLTPDQQQTASFRGTIKILKFILDKASNKESFEMAIHQHMVQYVQKSNIKTSNLHDILELIKLLQDSINNANMSVDNIQRLCTRLITKISIVPVPRDPKDLSAMKRDTLQIVEFFQSLSGNQRFQSITLPILNHVYQLITKDEEPSSLTYLGLAVIPDAYIGEAVAHFLDNKFYQNQKKPILNAIKRLISWQVQTILDVPLHLWIVKVLTALHDEKHYEMLHEIISTFLVKCFLTLLLPAFQLTTFTVVQTMLELQRSEKIFENFSPRILRTLEHLEKLKNEKACEIFEPLLDVISDYISSFPNAHFNCKDLLDYLEAHGRSPSRSISQRRHHLSLPSSLSHNVRIGLENLGNTCYMNSVIQALFMTKPLCNELLTMDRQDRETLVFQKIFGLLLFSERSEINLKFAMPFIRPVDFLPGIQQDSSEFMSSLLDKLHEADKKIISLNCNNLNENDEKQTKMDVNDDDDDDDDDEFAIRDKIIDNTSKLNQSTIVQKNFGGKISTTCVCSTCNSRSVNIDSFRDLALSFPEKERNEDDDWDAQTEYSVQELLDFYFTTEQLTLDGDNQYHCEKCKSLCDGIRCTEILQPPKNLILTLKHFRYDSRCHVRSKLLINKMFHNEEISVKVRSSHASNSWRNVNYRLYAAVVHTGISMDCGHYYTFAHEKDEIWYKFNDSFVSTSTLQELHNLNSPNTPYILFYRRISTATSTPSSSSSSSSTACSIDQLIPSTDEKLPNFNELPSIVKSFISDDNESFKKESILYPYKPLQKSNRWNDDDPPSSCGSNLDIQHNRFIY